MKKKILIGATLVLFVGIVAGGLMYWPPEDAGNAIGRVSKQDMEMQKELWGSFSKYERSFLSAYSEQFSEQPNDPLELVSAFNELAYGVTGPGGLWRKTVPNKYFGCAADQDTPVCQSLKQAADAEFQRWDKLQQAANDVEEPKDALKFLRTHRKDIDEYLQSLVPEKESMSAVQATPFFADKIAPAL